MGAMAGPLGGSPASGFVQAAAALSYMGCAVLLLLFNKAALSSWAFPYPNVITLLQLLVSNALLLAGRVTRAIKFADDGRALPGMVGQGRGFVTRRGLVTVAPLSAAFLAYMLLSMASLKGVNLPMYTTLRRTTAMFTLGAEVVVGRKRHPPAVVASVGLMVAGALVAGAGDLAFDVKGYAFVIGCNAVTAVYLAAIARYSTVSGLNSFGLMWCNGLICTPVLFVVLIANGELAATLRLEALESLAFRAVLVVSCTLAFALNYAIFLNTTVNSALTQTVCGNLKDIVVIVVGFFSFGGVELDLLNVVGIAIGVLGSVSYAYVKLSSPKKVEPRSG